jgi:hypothetical protein
MPMTSEDHEKSQKELNNVLNISADKYYFDKVRVKLIEFNKTYHTDRELNRTITEVINRADSAAVAKNYTDLEESYQNMFSCITSKGYDTIGPMRYGSEKEKDAVKEIISMINDLTMILRYEKEPEKEEHKIRERLNYREPNGNNPGYNLDDLSNRGPKPNKERIPNSLNEEPKYAY